MSYYFRNIGLVLVVLFSLVACNKTKNQYQDVVVNRVVLQQVDTLEARLNQLVVSIKEAKDSTAIRQAFVESRLAYKEIEWAVSYFLPHTAKSLNGPALDQVDLDENKFIPAEGFQVIEEHLYPTMNQVDEAALMREALKVTSFANAIRKNFEVITISDSQLFEALKLELFQITAMGMTGFDTPASKLQFIEAAASLNGVKTVLDVHEKWISTQAYRQIQPLLTKAIASCAANPDKLTFDYLDFMTTYLDPITQGIYALQLELNIPAPPENQLVRGTVASLFDKNLINLDALVPDSTYYMTPAKVVLGKSLFGDKNLSKDSARSCADCHHSDKAFADGLKAPLDLKGLPLQRNTPSLNYAAYYHGQFWDMRSVTLESQSSDVITNKDEMHGNLADIVAHLNQSKDYVNQFQKVYKQKGPIEVWQLENALAAYIRSLSTFNSRFDQYMNGQKRVLTQQEKKGFNLFVGKGQCATCHFMPLFNGTLPPSFTNSEHEVLGVPATKAGVAVDTDLGRYVFNTDLTQLKYAFKTPTLRNIAESGPYMHNGVYETLEEVMDFYNKGGGLGLGIQVDSQTLPEDPLNLTDAEIQDIIAFMKTLSDTK